MATRDELRDWVVDALRRMGGEAHLIDIAKDIWNQHEQDLRRSGDLFFTWQYDMRWAGTALRKAGLGEPAEGNGKWQLSRSAR